MYGPLQTGRYCKVGNSYTNKEVYAQTKVLRTTVHTINTVYEKRIRDMTINLDSSDKTIP